MKFEFVRTDVYKVEVEADSREEAIEKVTTEEEYLNDGSYCGSEFDIDE